MITKTLGNSDLSITRFGLGAWAIGGEWKFGWSSQNDTDSISAIHKALEHGINWIDTAHLYGLGHSEEIIAQALASWTKVLGHIFLQNVECSGTRIGKSPTRPATSLSGGNAKQPAAPKSRRH